MTRYIHIIILVWLLYTPSFAQEENTVEWLSFEQLSDSLAVKPKKVMLFFHTDWCAYCRKMQNDVFTDPNVVAELNKHYYVVKFDAESTDTVRFDGQIIVNAAQQKRRGEYHDITKLLAARNGEFSFPTTLMLNPDFTIQQRFFQYLDRKKLLNALTAKQ